MTSAPRPPRFARWLLERALPADVRDDVSGDIEELFRRRWGSEGATRSRLWYWRQVFAFSARFRTERLRERHTHRDMTTGISWMDFKLAVRMLVRYPGLTIIGVLGGPLASPSPRAPLPSCTRSSMRRCLLTKVIG